MIYTPVILVSLGNIEDANASLYQNIFPLIACYNKGQPSACITVFFQLTIEALTT